MVSNEQRIEKKDEVKKKNKQKVSIERNVENFFTKAVVRAKYR